jgi:hypothetical protein
MDSMRALSVLIAVLAAAGAARADLASDLSLLGVPVDSVAYCDSELVVSIRGSLAEGDSLLKYYGGIVFTLIDSVAAGWPVTHLSVDIPGSRLRIERSDFLEAVLLAAGGQPSAASSERIATWVLEHTRVYHFIE